MSVSRFGVPRVKIDQCRALAMLNNNVEFRYWMIYFCMPNQDDFGQGAACSGSALAVACSVSGSALFHVCSDLGSAFDEAASSEADPEPCMI